MAGIKTALIGAGRIGRMHAENIYHFVPELTLSAVCDPMLDLQWLASLEGVTGVKQADTIWQDKHIEAVIIAAPSVLHQDLVRQALRHNKQVFCEKPLAFDSAVILQLEAQAKAVNKYLQVGLNRRFDPDYISVAERLQAGEIGQPYLIHLMSHGAQCAELSFIRQSGGLLMDLSVHDFDLLHFITGQTISQVFAVGSTRAQPELAQLGDVASAMITLKLSQGTLATIDNSRHNGHGYEQRVEILGSEGRLAVENHCSHHVIKQNEPDIFQAAFINELRHFAAVIQGQEKLRAGATEMAKAVQIAAKAQESMQRAQAVKVEQDKVFA